MIEEAIILAAGLGRRLGINSPKCLIEINGRSLLDYQLTLLKDIPRISIVTGFKQELIHKKILYSHKDLVRKIRFVHNSHYKCTSNVFSLSLITKHIIKPTLILMSDLLIDRQSYKQFISQASSSKSLIAVTETKSRDSICVKIDADNYIRNISKEIKTNYEWVGMYYTSNLIIDVTRQNIYQLAYDHLPSKYLNINCWEIDTKFDWDTVKKSFQIT